MRRPTVCLATLCDSRDEQLLWDHAVPWMTRPWIDCGVILFTDRQQAQSTNGRFVTLGANYGRGWDRSPSDGGFDEIAARLHLRTIAKEMADWILFWTPDEIFLDSTYDVLCRAHEEHYHCAWFSWYNVMTPNLQMVFENGDVLVNGVGPTLRTPHAVAVRSTAGIYHVPSENFTNLVNPTLHCQLNTWILPASHQYRAGGVHHLHLAYLLSPKRDQHPPPGAPTRYWLELFDDRYLPDAVKDLWRSQGCLLPKWGGRVSI